MEHLRVLLLEDNVLDAELTLAALEEGGFRCAAERVDTRAAFEGAVDRGGFDVILADHRLPSFDGLTALRLAHQRRPEVPFIFLSGTLGEETAVEAMRNGATDYVLKQKMGRLAPSVRRALREHRERLALRQAEDALRRSEERCALLIENAQDFAIVALDPAGRVQTWNPGAQLIFGYAAAEVTGRPFEIFFTPEDRAAAAPADELDLAARDGRAPHDRWHVRKDGSRFWASGVTTAVRDGGRLTGYLKICRDLTDKRRGEEALRQYTQRLELLSDASRYILSHNDPRLLIDTLYEKLATHLGLDIYAAHLVDASGRELRLFASRNVPPDVESRLAACDFEHQFFADAAAGRARVTVADVQSNPHPAAAEVRALGINAYACFPLLAHGRLLGTLAFGTRSRRGFEADELELMQIVCDEIAVAMDRVQILDRERQARLDAEAANRAKDEFLATVSHELRTPLTAILGWARMLSATAEGADPQTLAEGLETIERNARVQAQLIEDILDISRIITGRLRLNIEPTDLRGVVREAVDAVRPGAEAKGVRLMVTASEPALVLGDPQRLQQVVWNLLTNAIKFTPAGGRVTVSLARDTMAADAVRVVVTDTGKGIPPEFLPHVFDRFRQADASITRRHGGLGLGLSIVRHLVEQHGGMVEARSEGDGRGATFLVSLPLLETGPPARSRPASTADVPSSSSAASSRDGGEVTAGANRGLDCPPALDGVHVLVVDDEPDARRMVSAVLARCNAIVTTAGSVAEALGHLEQVVPDVLLSDIGMPEEDGYSLIRRVRQRPAGQGGTVPAAALTAYTRVEDSARVLEAGFQMFLPKPVEPAVLIDAVAKLVKRENLGAETAGSPAR